MALTQGGEQVERVAASSSPSSSPASKSASGYVELTVRSNFSFLQGASPPERLVQRAVALGYDTVAITDRDGIYGAVRALEEAIKLGARLVLGCELTVALGALGASRDRLAPDVSRGFPGKHRARDEDEADEADEEKETRDEGGARRGGGAPARRRPARHGADAAFSTVTVLVEDHAGYTNLCRLLTMSHARYGKGDLRPREERGGLLRLPRNTYAGLPLDAICEHAGGLWALAHHHDAAHVAKLRDAFGERLGVAVHRHVDGEDRVRAQRARDVARALDVPLVATNAVRYAERDEKPVYDVLHCVREGCTLDQAGRALAPNAEACLKSEEAMRRLFRDLPGAIERTRVIADACRFSLKELKYKFPCELEEPAFPGETADQALRRLTYEGIATRYGEAPEAVRAQVEKELALIAQLDVAPYFLSVRTIVDMARRRDILCQGRGSAANSAVCYCLGITAVDPSRSNLLFERFLSTERREPPDIDVDFEHERREEVIQEIYERYGRDRAAMVCEIISYRGKSALRDVGKVFGLSLEQVGRLASAVHWFDPVRSVDEERLRSAGFDPADRRVRMVVAMAQAIQGFPRHLSIHVGGFVLSAEPLVHVAPVEPATMDKRTIIPWDKDDLDTLGFFKVDVLGLGMLTAIRKALDLASARDPRVDGRTAIDRLAQIPKEDPDVYEALCHADTVGVFQIESRAQMAMLPRLRPRAFYDLVVEVAIVRPGPIQGGMIHPYLRRRSGEEPADAPHAILAPILARTLGVPLFQEQVMQIAIVGAGYSGGEADQLRRDMAAWRRNGNLKKHRARLLEGFRERGIDEAFGERIYSQIMGFGEYGFPESHAASFALLVYASSWLKVHHPAAFAASLVNSQPMGFYSPSTILQDAQRHGVVVRPVCVQSSAWDCTLEDDDDRDDEAPRADRGAARGDGGGGPAIRVGLRQVKGLGEAAGRRIEASRAAGPFASIEDLASRASIDGRDLELLAESGAIGDRRSALWEVRAPRGEGLFRGAERGDLPAVLPKLTRVEQLSLDYERTGLSVNDHPMRLLRPTLPKRVWSAARLATARHGERASVAGLVICRQRPQTASGVVFITLEDETGFSNLIVFARVFEEQRHVATTSALLVAHGKVERASEVVYVVAARMELLRMESAPLPSMSRDFH